MYLFFFHIIGWQHISALYPQNYSAYLPWGCTIQKYLLPLTFPPPTQTTHRSGRGGWWAKRPQLLESKASWGRKTRTLLDWSAHLTELNLERSKRWGREGEGERESGRRKRKRTAEGGDGSCWNFNRPREKKKTWRKRMRDGRGQKNGS